MLLNFRPDIVTVELTFEDGSKEAYEVVKGGGFVREGYTYRQDKENSEKVTGVLHTFEVFWTKTTEVEDAARQSA